MIPTDDRWDFCCIDTAYITASTLEKLKRLFISSFFLENVHTQIYKKI